MKKKISKLKFILAAVCLSLMLPVMTSYAAEGTLELSDVTGKVGEEIVVRVRAAETAGQPIGDVQATLSYDPSLLEFVNGTNAEASEGEIVLSALGTGAETEHSFELTFKALAEGSTSIQVTGSTAYLFSDEVLNLVPGTAEVTIGAEDGTSGERVTSEENIEIAGTMYAIYENFTEALIPDGFEKTVVNYNGEEHSAIRQNASGAVFFYMITGSNDPVLVQYDESDNSLYVSEQVYINEEFYLMILGKGDGSSLPEKYESTTMELKGTVFPVWQDMSATDYYLVYALSSKGTEGFYQYDSTENTYQRYEVPVTEKEEEPEETLLTKAQGYVNQYFLIFAAVIAALFLLLIIIIMILLIRLRHKAAESDEFYDSYDDDGYDEDLYEDDDDEGDYEEDDYEDDDYDEDDYDEDDYDEDDYDEDDEFYEDDDEDDDVEETMSEKKGRKRSADTEDFGVDFIDL